jgi:hypothetical protein
MMEDPMASLDQGEAPDNIDHNTKQVFDPMAMQMNLQRIERIRSIMGIASGCVAGIAGLTGLQGLGKPLCMIPTQAFCSVLQTI